MHGVIAEAGVQWDPNKWNGDSWDSDEIGSPDEFVDVRPAWRQKVELDANGQQVRRDTQKIILSMK